MTKVESGWEDTEYPARASLAAGVYRRQRRKF